MSSAFIDGLGAALARAREEQGLSQADAASRLKLSVRQIEAIEAEDWAQLPGEVFRRGFVRNYARMLELNPDELVRPVDTDATATHTITAPSEGLAIGRSPIARWVAFPLAGLLLFLLVVALLYQWLKQGEQTLLPPPDVAETSSPLTSGAVAEAPGGTGQVTPGQGVEGIGEGAVDTVVQPLELDTQPAASETSAAEAAGQGMEAPAAMGNNPQTTQPPNPASTPPPSSSGDKATLRFTPLEDSWIQVVDAQGQRFSKLVRAGAREQLVGEPPFKLVVGNAANVNLTYNGHQIDLTPFIGEKVARLTLE